MDLASDGNTGPVTARYGAWPSPIGASDVAVAGIRLSGPVPVHTDAGDEVWWAEGPTDRGRPDRGGPAGRRRRGVRRAAGGLERPHPGARVRRERLAPAARRRAGLRGLGRPAGLPARSGLDHAGAAHPGAGRDRGPAVRGPGARPGRRRDLVGARGARRGHDPPRTWSRCRCPARPPPTPARCGRSSAAATSSPSRGRRRTGGGWPGSPGTTRGCRGTAPSCGSASSARTAR